MCNLDTINSESLLSAYFRGPPGAVKILGKDVINTSEFLKILKTQMLACKGKYILIFLLNISQKMQI